LVSVIVNRMVRHPCQATLKARLFLEQEANFSSQHAGQVLEIVFRNAHSAGQKVRDLTSERLVDHLFNRDGLAAPFN
jgi:hypothetical protein